MEAIILSIDWMGYMYSGKEWDFRVSVKIGLLLSPYQMIEGGKLVVFIKPKTYWISQLVFPFLRPITGSI